MSLTLSWDLFIIVLFATVMAYAFIIGKTQSVRIIIGTYIAIVATQGIGNIVARLAGESEAAFALIGFDVDVTVFGIIKIVLLAIFVIVLNMKSGIDVTYSSSINTAMTLVYTLLFGFATAGLLVSTLLAYALGGGLLDQSLPTSEAIVPVLEANPLMEILVVNQDFWFTLPALLLVGVGLIRNKDA